MKYRAAVLHRVNTPLAVETRELAALEPGDVLVRIMASALCRRDLEVIRGSPAHALPVVPGHEGAGIAEAVGSEVTRVRVGEHVVCSSNPHCGACFYCDRSLPILCEAFPRFIPSTHAGYAIVPESAAIPVPAEIPFDRACLIGGAVMTGLGAVLHRAKIAAGAHVAVIGCGAVGLNAIQAARLVDSAKIIAVDVAPAKLDLARAFGASETVDASDPGAADRIRALTAGRGADYVIEAAGSKSALRLSVDAVRPGGKVVWLGRVGAEEEVSFRWGSLTGEKRFVHSGYGDALPLRDFPWIALEYLEGRLKLDELITRRIKLAQINDGFAALARGEGIRTVIEMD